MKARHAKFNGAVLAGWIVDADFSGSDFTNADLRQAIFIQCTFEGAVLRRAKVRGETFAQIALTPEQRGQLIV